MQSLPKDRPQQLTFRFRLLSQPKRFCARESLTALVNAGLIEAWPDPDITNWPRPDKSAAQVRGRTYAMPHWLCGYFIFTRNHFVADAKDGDSLVAALKVADAALTRFSPEKCLFFVRHSLQDITVRGRVITNSNVLCYDNIPLCKELIWRSLGDAERHPGRVAILWLCFATLLRPLS